MSIILKALKRAEESKGEKVSVKKTEYYPAPNKDRRGIIIAAIAVTALLIFAGLYWAKGRTISMLRLKSADKIIAVPKSGLPKEPQPDVENAAILHEDAIKQIKAKNYSEAEGILRKAILLKPDDAIMHNHLGLALKNQGKYNEASRAYEKALQLDGNYCEAMNNLAVTYEMLGNREKAKPMYKKALSIKPSYEEAHLNYALLLESEGNKSEAESHYHTFLNLSSDASLKSKVKERLRGLKQ